MPGVTSISGGGDQIVTVFGNGSVIAGGGNDSISVIGHGGITVGGGNDLLNLYGGGSISELGATGSDTISLVTGSDTINVQGSATVSGPWGTSGPFGGATVSGGELDVHFHDSLLKAIAVSGSTTLQGGLLPTEFVGGSGWTTMLGGAASDTFIGGSGSDTMTGGTGTNLFAFETKEAGGSHLITNFVSGSDTLYLEGDSLGYLKSHGDISSTGGNTFIKLDGGSTTIELQGVSSLKSSDITTHKP